MRDQQRAVLKWHTAQTKTLSRFLQTDRLRQTTFFSKYSACLNRWQYFRLFKYNCKCLISDIKFVTDHSTTTYLLFKGCIPGYILLISLMKLSSNPAMMAPPTGTMKFLSRLWTKASILPTRAPYKNTL